MTPVPQSDLALYLSLPTNERGPVRERIMGNLARLEAISHAAASMKPSSKVEKAGSKTSRDQTRS